jgi:CheY-like chemotaxis protein
MPCKQDQAGKQSTAPERNSTGMATKLADPDSIKSFFGRPRLRLVPKIQPKVLIVEDHDDSRDMLSIILGLKNCCVTEASNGLEAVELALRIQPDVILMDGSLPLIDGLEATRRIRANEVQREIYIIAMNGWGTRNYRDDALAAGCDECLVKPIDLDRVDSLLAPFFTESSQPRVAFAHA